MIKVNIQSHFAGGYRLEYDGKYITLYGKDRNYPMFCYGKDCPGEYEEMVLIAIVEEVKNANPHIVKITDEHIYIENEKH